MSVVEFPVRTQWLPLLWVSTRMIGSEIGGLKMAALHLEKFGDTGLDEEEVLARLAWMREAVAPRLERYLGYYRNRTTDLAGALGNGPAAVCGVRPFRQFQELGLPTRVTGFKNAADGSGRVSRALDMARKEVVIENDICWRIDTFVDFAAGRMPGVTSTARDPALRGRLNAVIAQILGSACGRGCLQLLQELALQGCIQGSAWVQVRPSAALLARLAAPADAAEALESAEASRWLSLEVFDARHVMTLGKYVLVVRDVPADMEAVAPRGAGLLGRMRAWLGGSASGPDAEEFSFDIIGPDRWQRYERGELVEEGANPLGMAPFVRYENGCDPAAGTRVGPAGSGAVDVGLSDVEPLMGLQDELNTRLSDRAFRVTMTSFRMYLGKGIEDFIKRPVGPGQLWETSNPDASIEAFGGDQNAPGETAHIEEVREALDKISGVPPVAAGLIRSKLGNLTSAVALRVTLIALLARTERKRAALTRAMAEIVRLALAMLDMAGVIKTAEEDRGIDVNWPTALPESDMDRLTEAQAKLALGLPRELVLTELGYGEVAANEKQEGRAAPVGGGGVAG